MIQSALKNHRLPVSRKIRENVFISFDELPHIFAVAVGRSQKVSADFGRGKNYRIVDRRNGYSE